MKKISLTLILLFSLSISLTFAKSNDPIPDLPRKALDQTFPGHQFARWQYLAEADLYIARFFYHEENVFAYINPDGQITATARNLERNQLPLLVVAKLNYRYPGCTIMRLEELTMNTETSYLLLLENGRTRHTVQIYPSGSSYELHKEKLRTN